MPFAENKMELVETESLSSVYSVIEEEEECLNYTLGSCSYADLSPGEEESCFAELPSFGDSPSSVLPLASTPLPISIPTTISEDLKSALQLEPTSPPSPFLWCPPPLPSAPSFEKLAVPEDFALDYAVVNEEMEVHDWEASDSSEDGYYDDLPCFLSPAPIPSPSQLAYLSSHIEVEVEVEEEGDESCEYLYESFAHLPSLRVVLLNARERGIPDWRDWLRRDAILRSANKQQLPCWIPL